MHSRLTQHIHQCYVLFIKRGQLSAQRKAVQIVTSVWYKILFVQTYDFFFCLVVLTTPCGVEMFG